MILNRIKRGFSAPEGIWKPSPALLCQGTVLTPWVSQQSLWLSDTGYGYQTKQWRLLLLFRLCNEICVAEQEMSVGIISEWNKGLHCSCITVGSGQLHPSQGIHRFKTKVFCYQWRLALLPWWGHLCHICFWLQFLIPVPDIFNNSLMNECCSELRDWKEPIMY